MECIYCGTSEDLSESDIIPDALTNARIINRNVCRVAHNNRFSDLFESKVISDLSFITNELDIKSSKGKKYASYAATIKIDGTEYETSLQNDKSIFDGRVLKSKDKKHFMSSMETITKIAKDENLVQQIDVNQIEVEKSVRINTEIFFDESMFRMISKIAYEWYCAKNGVCGKHTEFDNIISYITNGEGECLVSIIQEEELYKYLSMQANLGSHVLFAFETIENEISVVVSLFGIIMYKVIVAKSKPKICNNNFVYIELRTDSTRKEIIHESIGKAEEYLKSCLDPSNFNPVSIGGMKIILPQNIYDTSDVPLYLFVFNMVEAFRNIKDKINTPNESIVKIIINQIENIVQSSSLHKKSIKRFVNEYFGDGHEIIQLNPNTSNKKATMLFYVVFIVGKSGLRSLDDVTFQNLLRKELNLTVGEELHITNELEEELKSRMMSIPSYQEILEKGAETIKKWI